MKKFCSFLVVTLIIQFSNAQKITKAFVKSVPLYIETPFDIPCEIFDESFSDHNLIKIKSRDLNSFREVFAKSKIIKNETMDVRGKILIYVGSRVTRTLCFTKSGIFYDGKKYFDNKSLLQFLFSHNLVRN